jgi:hypothetical protein
MGQMLDTNVTQTRVENGGSSRSFETDLHFELEPPVCGKFLGANRLLPGTERRLQRLGERTFLGLAGGCACRHGSFPLDDLLLLGPFDRRQQVFEEKR